jgi:hypothetical protein
VFEYIWIIRDSKCMRVSVECVCVLVASVCIHV